MESLASAVAIWSTTIDLSKELISEGLPHDKRTVRDIVVNMATSIGIQPRFVSVDHYYLKALPQYSEKSHCGVSFR